MKRQRNNMQEWTKAEHAIYNAVQEIEKMGSNQLLTIAIRRLNDAQDLVADYLDIHPESVKNDIIPLTEENIRLLDERQELQEEAMGGCGYERRVILVEKIVAIEERLGIYGTPLSRILDLKGYLEMRYGK